MAPARHTDAARARRRRARNAAMIVVLGGLWLVADQASKAALDGSFQVGEHIAGPFLGLVRLVLVHNTGMAWGMLDDSTLLLGAFSLAVCAALVAYLLVAAPRTSWGELVGGTLVAAGGLGNAIDRFALGYVVDFIEPVFIDFPVFNIADIGVTCGCVIFLIAFLWRDSREQAGDAHVHQDPAGEGR